MTTNCNNTNALYRTSVLYTTCIQNKYNGLTPFSQSANNSKTDCVYSLYTHDCQAFTKIDIVIQAVYTVYSLYTHGCQAFAKIEVVAPTVHTKYSLYTHDCQTSAKIDIAISTVYSVYNCIFTKNQVVKSIFGLQRHCVTCPKYLILNYSLMMTNLLTTNKQIIKRG